MKKSILSMTTILDNILSKESQEKLVALFNEFKESPVEYGIMCSLDGVDIKFIRQVDTDSSIVSVLLSQTTYPDRSI